MRNDVLREARLRQHGGRRGRPETLESAALLPCGASTYAGTELKKQDGDQRDIPRTPTTPNSDREYLTRCRP